MKHFGANLAGLTNEVDGNGEISVLTIAAGDKFVITDANQLDTNVEPTGSTDGSVDGGLFIAGGTADVPTTNAYDNARRLYYLDAFGQEKELTPYLAVELGLNGNDLTLRDHLGNDISAAITLPSGGGGGGGTAQLNDTPGDLPVRWQDNFGRALLRDSLISEEGTLINASIGTGAVNGAVAAGGTTINISGIVFSDTTGGQAAFNSRYNTGAAASILVGGVEYTGTLTGTGTTAALTAFTPVVPAAGIANGIEVIVQVAAESYSADTVRIGGNLIVDGTTTTIDSNNLVVRDRFITVGAQEEGTTGTGNDQLTGIDSVVDFASDGSITHGARIQYNGSTDRYQVSTNTTGAASGFQDILINTDLQEGQGISIDARETTLTGLNTRISVDINTAAGLTFSNTTDAAAIEVKLAPTTTLDGDATGGLTFVTSGTAEEIGQIQIAAGGVSEHNLNVATDTTNGGVDNPTSGQLLAYNHANDGTFTWVDGATGTVGKSTIPFTKSASTDVAGGFIRINNNADAGRRGVTENHGLGTASATDLFTVQVYETATNGLTQIIPEAVTIYTAAGTDPAGNATAAGDVVVVFGNSAVNGSVVIKS